MAILRSVADLRADIGISDIPDVNEALESACRTATEALVAQLRTDFSRVTVVDEFFVSRSLRSGMAGPAGTTFKLTRGFVDSAQTINVYVAGSPQYLTDPNNRDDLQDVDGQGTSVVRIQYERGYMLVRDWNLTDTWVRVEYTAGFATDGGNPEIYEGTPQWLQELVTLKVSQRLDQHNVFPRASRRTEEERQDTQNIEILAGEIIDGHARYMPMAIKPEWYEETAV